MSKARTRSSDPDTSRLAADSFNVNSTEMLVLKIIKSGPATGMTKDEVTAEQNMHPRDSISPRFVPLEEKGLIVRVGKKAGNLGRSQTLWLDVERARKEVTETKKKNPFIFVDFLMKGEDPFKGADVELLERDYNPFLINRALSYNPKTIFYAAEMNYYNNLPARMQYDYLNKSIKPGSRSRSSWAKPDKSDNVLLVSDYYNYSMPQAREALKLLSDSDLEIMRDKMKRGGENSGRKG